MEPLSVDLEDHRGAPAASLGASAPAFQARTTWARPATSRANFREAEARGGRAKGALTLAAARSPADSGTGVAAEGSVAVVGVV